MTRAKEELYISYGRLREFRGQTLYAVPSMFLDELPESGVETLDLSHTGAGKPRPQDAWRGGRGDSAQAWRDAGVTLQTSVALQAKTAAGDGPAYEEGMLVQHDKYGMGRIISVGGQGAMRKIKIRFQAGGERTFVAHMAKLEIVRRN